MELDASIEPTIGPYEVYEDEWFNYKAAFEAFITLRDDAETAKLQRSAASCRSSRTPADRSEATATRSSARWRRSASSTSCSPPATPTAACRPPPSTCPNDERVVKEKGTKRVMLKNVQEAKFEKVLLPIAKVALPAGRSEQRVVRRVLHPHPDARADARPGPAQHHGRRAQTTVRQELKETYSAIEEAKADISGLWALQQLVDKRAIDKAIARTMYTTFLASAFRSIRFGVNEAHGRGIAIQLELPARRGRVRRERRRHLPQSMQSTCWVVSSLSRGRHGHHGWASSGGGQLSQTAKRSALIGEHARQDFIASRSGRHSPGARPPDADNDRCHVEWISKLPSLRNFAPWLRDVIPGSPVADRGENRARLARPDRADR